MQLLNHGTSKIRCCKCSSSSITIRARITDDNTCFVVIDFVRIACTPTNSISKDTKRIDLRRTTKCLLFNKDDVKIKELNEYVDGVK